MSVPGNMCKVPGEFQRDFCREWRMELFVLQRENMMTHLQSQQHFNWFRLDADGAHKVHTVHKSTLWIQRAICKRPENCYAHKVHKCTSTHSNIDLYH